LPLKKRRKKHFELPLKNIQTSEIRNYEKKINAARMTACTALCCADLKFEEYFSGQ
jgi:hypothetical protein